jgi:uncharacterized protein (TIGR03437 family)
MNPHMRRLVWILFVPLLLGAQARRDDYALVLDSPPLVERISSRQELKGSIHAAAIQAEQGAVRAEVARRKVRITGAASTLVNAIFIRATATEAAALAGIAGVRRVEYLPPLKRHLNRAVDLVRAPQAWNIVGGVENAGVGIKIGIIDTGIDKDHAAFQDASLAMPAGFPKGRPEELPFTSNKVIVARSYVAQLPFADVNARDSRPDDITPRDRVGHGTAAAMIAAGRRVTGPAATIQGVAPKAYLGNYKVFGSPGVNDTTRAPVMIQALEDAFRDGMDVVTLSIGRPAFYGPLDRRCGTQSNELCDVRADAVENAVKNGMAVVVSAGNDGDIGSQFPSLNTIHTPGTAPSAITVGATTNSHILFASVRPDSGARFDALFGNGPKPNPTVRAPLRDVTQVQNDGRACAPLGNGTLAGVIALIQRGNCAFADKVNNAQKAGAIGVVLYQLDGQNGVFPPVGLSETGIPLAFVGFDSGVALKRLNGQTVTLDPALVERDAPFDSIAYFSSHGPSVGDASRGEAPIKPELVAVGTDMYTAAQSFDPNGDLYDPKGFIATQGTSFSVPMVAGAVAMVKQRNPRMTPGQLKSAVVNTATGDIGAAESNAFASIASSGAGKLQADAAVQAVVSVEPATLSFGVVGAGSLPISISLRLTNTGSSTQNLTLAVSPRGNDSRARVTLSATAQQLAGGQTATIAVRLEGTQPSPGRYEGNITIRGGSVNLRVPYMYLVGDGVANNLVSLAGDGFLGAVSEQGWLMAFKAIDQYGVPVQNAAVRFRVMSGGGRISAADASTDVYGIAAANVDLGPTLGEQQFRAEVGSLTLDFFGRARLTPVIDSNGVVNAASFQLGNGLAPGSYITIRGRGLSEITRIFNTTSLPVSLAGVSVSFDDQLASRKSLPGRIHFVSENQINVQIPWEYEGSNTVLMKVSIGPGDADSSAVFTVPLAKTSPAFFEYDDQASGRRLLAGLDQGFKLLTVANPARKTNAIQLYCNGLGPVSNRPPSGEPSPGEPLAETVEKPAVSIGGRPAQVLFSGLAPGIVGLYQVNVVVPSDAPNGLQPVVVTMGGVASRASTIAVE